MDQTLKHNGFTLIELSIVLVIISILAVGTYFSWQANTINLDGQANQVANDIRYAQSLAMTKGQRYRFIKSSGNTYQITNNAGSPVPLPLGGTSATLKAGVIFGSFTNLPSSLIVFDGKGTPYIDTGSPGTALTTTATIPLTTGSETKTISINPETGRVIVQ